METLLYVAPALTIMNAEANHIMAPILMSGLNAIGIQHYLPQAVIYAPLKYQGLAVLNLYIETSIQHVTLLLQKTPTNTPTGLLLCMIIEAMKVKTGVGRSLFEPSFAHYGSLATDCWVKHTWHFLLDHDILIADQVGDLQLHHHGDHFLTDAFIQHGIKGAALKHLNACCLFLQVETLSNITTTNGSTEVKSCMGGSYFMVR